MKKWKQDWIGTCGFERTRWVMWGLRLERRGGGIWRRGFTGSALIRALEIKWAISWFDFEMGAVGKTFLTVSMNLWDDICFGRFRI